MKTLTIDLEHQTLAAVLDNVNYQIGQEAERVKKQGVALHPQVLHWIHATLDLLASTANAYELTKEE